MTPSVQPITDPLWHVPGAGHGARAARDPLPMSRREMESRGWQECDVVLITGDAYVDHPSFGVALVGRFLEWLGYRVGVIAQPDATSPDAFLALGRPRLFWGVTAGNLDSELARLTVMRKRRHDDPYAPGGKAGSRPPNASIVYASKARQAHKGVPVILGGVEASLRRFAFYDYWTDRVRRSLLFDAKADTIAFGMAERSLAAIAARLREGQALGGIEGTAEIRKTLDGIEDVVELPAFEAVSPPTDAGRAAFTEMARLIHVHTVGRTGHTLVQRHGDRWLVAHPPPEPLATEELDALYALPFSNKPHPAYGQARIPAYDMIKDSITVHRGCYGGCSFCAIGVHQGTTITSRSRVGVVAQAERMARDPAFHGTISDLGGPTANMYGTRCKLGGAGCHGKRMCLFPTVCRNLETDHAPLLALLRAVRQVPGVRHVFVTSGLRYDLALQEGGDAYLDELIAHYICGRLKIAPEHVSPGVLTAMRKPAPESYREFVRRFRERVRRAGRKHQVVEYFISGHPGCSLQDMVELAVYLKRAGVQPEQVQDFYPAPMTLAAAMFYTGRDPLSGEAVYVPRTDREKALQRALLLCHKREFQRKAREALREAGRENLIGHGGECLVPPGP